MMLVPTDFEGRQYAGPKESGKKKGPSKFALCFPEKKKRNKMTTHLKT